MEAEEEKELKAKKQAADAEEEQKRNEAASKAAEIGAANRAHDNAKRAAEGASNVTRIEDLEKEWRQKRSYGLCTWRLQERVRPLQSQRPHVQLRCNSQKKKNQIDFCLPCRVLLSYFVFKITLLFPSLEIPEKSNLLRF